MADDQDVLLPLQLHDDGLQALDQVLVRLQTRRRDVEAAVIRRGRRFSFYVELITEIVSEEIISEPRNDAVLASRG